MTWKYPGALSIKMVFSVRVIFGNVGGFRKNTQLNSLLVFLK